MSKNIRRICCVLRKKTMHPSDTKKGEQTNRGKDLDTKMVRGYGGGGGGAEDNGASGVGGGYSVGGSGRRMQLLSRRWRRIKFQ